MSRQGKKRMRPFEPKRVAESARELYDLLKQFNNDRYQTFGVVIVTV